MAKLESKPHFFGQCGTGAPTRSPNHRFLMRRLSSVVLLVLFVHALVAPSVLTGVLVAQQDVQTFHGTIKYLGGIGFPNFKGHESWDITMTITPDSVQMIFAESEFHPMSFAVANVTKIEYGQAATRHVGRWVAIGVIFAPIALLGMLHKSRHHFVTVSYTDGGQERGVYFEANKDIVRNLLNTLSYRSKKPIYADEKDKKYLLTEGVLAQLAPDSK